MLPYILLQNSSRFVPEVLSNESVHCRMRPLSLSMFRSCSKAIFVILLLQVMFLPRAGAAVFPDVSDSHLYREAVEVLVGMEVINGNPDGNFYPERTVNRAEMLKMLYKASQRAVGASKGCFPDVEKGSWYESYVCDAAAHRFVQGYSDGLFRPERTVNRVEAIKMIAEVFGLRVPELTEDVRGVVKFVDVSLSGWYTKYLYSAFKSGLLPVAGQDSARFYPDQALLRGEAAAYIHSALNVKDVWEEIVVEEEQGGMPLPPEEGGVTEELDKEFGLPPPEEKKVEEVEEPEDSPRDVSIPFDEGGAFTKKRVKVYRFSLSSPGTSRFEVSIRDGYAGGVICRLYKISEGGFSTEYYLGHREGNGCSLLVSLAEGSYQLEFQPTVANTQFLVKGLTANGDGNDGFRQAGKIDDGKPRTGIFTSNDFADWYKFTVGTEKKLTVELASAEELPCMIYPMEDVDLYGFSGPECNEAYDYPSGTYYVGVYRVEPKATKQTYTVRLK